MISVILHLHSNGNCNKALELYVKAFNVEILIKDMSEIDNKIVHSEILIDKKNNAK